jgi:hypothetical protein
MTDIKKTAPGEIEIFPVSEMIADTRRLCEVRFDCMVKMHDVGYRNYDGLWGQEKQSRLPQWFSANRNITLETVKYADPYVLGMQIKEMFHQLEKTIEQYEQS